MKQKIFNIGYYKCGTCSLTKAMQILGYKSIHHNLGGKILKEITLKNLKRNKKILSGMENFDFYSDFGGEHIYQKLDKQHPKSKFILTLREKNSWVESLTKQVSKKASPNYKENITKEDKINWIKQRTKKIKEILEYFKNRPDDLLVIDIIKGEGWKKLCKFLNQPVPKVPFPHKNRSEQQSLKLLNPT